MKMIFTFAVAVLLLPLLPVFPALFPAEIEKAKNGGF
jgi:hypothetical protein